MFRLRACLACLACSCAVACAASLPKPHRTEHPASAYADVPYPPAAAFVEVVSERPSHKSDQGKLVWLDGYWAWQGTEYSWRRGGWTIAPDGASYARWDTFVSDDGRVFFAESAWYTKQGKRLKNPQVLVPASTPRNAYTTEFQSAR